jgi:ribosome-associated protein
VSEDSPEEATLLESIDIARKAVSAASEKLANNIVLLDTRGENRLADFLVICSAESPRQIQAIQEEIHRALKAEGVFSHHDEGTSDSGWMLLDYGEVIVHIFSDTIREFYQLDKLWEEAKPLLRIQ